MVCYPRARPGGYVTPGAAEGLGRFVTPAERLWDVTPMDGYGNKESTVFSFNFFL